MIYILNALIVYEVDMRLLIFFISCMELQLCHGLAIGRSNMMRMVHKIVDGDDGNSKQDIVGIESKATEEGRRQMIIVTLSSLAAPIPALSYGLEDDSDSINQTITKRSYDDNILETINWSAPKSRGLNTERMADGINDSIKETSWLVGGVGRPEYFSDDFYFTNADYIPLMDVSGYENYCRRVRRKHLTEDASSFDLICCSVTSSNEITTLWRYHCKYSELQRIRKSKYHRVDMEKSQVIQTVFKTSDEDEGLVVSATEKIIISENAPDADALRAKCNWYKCTII